MDEWPLALAIIGLVLVLIMGLNMARGQGERALLYQERQAATRASVAIARAQPANVPAHYAPHVQITQAPERAALPGAPVQPPAPAIFTVPSTRALLDQGLIAAGRPLPVWTAAGPLYLSSGRLWTAGIGGRSGGGKTRTAGLLIGFEALNGADVLAIDPHRHKDDSLSRLIAPLGDVLLLPPAFTDAEVEAVLTRAAGELEARRAGRTRGRVLLVIDEYTSYQRRGGPLAQRMARLVEEYATEGRGYDCQALVMGQNWKASRSGGTEVREVLTSAIVHRSWKRQAAYLCPDDETAEAAESLVPGRAIFVPADDDPVEIGIPLTESADLARIAVMRRETARNGRNGGGVSVLEGQYQVAADPVSPFHFVPETGPETGGGAGDLLKREAVRQALQTDEEYGAIICRIWQVKPGGGAPYKAACTEMRTIVADLARGV